MHAHTKQLALRLESYVELELLEESEHGGGERADVILGNEPVPICIVHLERDCANMHTCQTCQQKHNTAGR